MPSRVSLRQIASRDAVPPIVERHISTFNRIHALFGSLASALQQHLRRSQDDQQKAFDSCLASLVRSNLHRFTVYTLRQQPISHDIDHNNNQSASHGPVLGNFTFIRRTGGQGDCRSIRVGRINQLLHPISS
jgi:hypothetical protein